MSSPRKGNKFTVGSPSALATSPPSTGFAQRPRSKTLATKPYIRVAPTDHSAPATIHAGRDQTYSDEAVILISVGNADGQSGPNGLFSTLGDKFAKSAEVPALRLDYKDASAASSEVISADVQAGAAYLKDHFSSKKLYLITYIHDSVLSGSDEEGTFNLGSGADFVGTSSANGDAYEEDLFQAAVQKLGRVPAVKAPEGAPVGAAKQRKPSFDILHGDEDAKRAAAEAGQKLARTISSH